MAGKAADPIERDIYSVICASSGIKARDIARRLNADRTTVNHYLYTSPYMQQLCRQDADHKWYGRISQGYPHKGLRDFCGYYASVEEFLQTDEETWFALMMEGCTDAGRNLNDTRGLFHSFRDTYEVMQNTFRDMDDVDKSLWEIAFETRIRLSKSVRIYADVLVIMPERVFSIEFKMKDRLLEDEVLQSAKYAPYLEIIFGNEADIIPALCLTGALDLYGYAPLPGTTGEIPVCSGDMLFNLFDEYLGFLDE
ncbi:MAG: winged helix-turn-helix domain-containing protein [Lachnospiraceae bacterium]|nr:winged helix-turn-helix domain-containing protein [Lachnospiraceae bacterium]